MGIARVHLPKIYRGHYSSGKPYWTLACSLPTGERYRKKWSSESAARKDEQRLIVLLGTNLTPKELSRSQLANTLLARAAESNPELKEVDIVALVEWALPRYVAPPKVKTLREYADDLISLKISQNRRACTINELRRAMRYIVEAFEGRLLESITLTHLVDFVEAQNGGPESVRRWQNHLAHLFKYLTGTCKSSPNPNPALKVNPALGFVRATRDHDDTKNIRVATAAELHAMLRAASKYNAQRMFAWLSFTGMRPFEAVKFWSNPEWGWKMINVERNVIHVPAKCAKTRRPRKIKIRPVLAQWLAKYRDHPNWMTGNWRDKYGWVKKEVYKNPSGSSDILRHTFISMLVESGEPWGKIELEVGNTKEIAMQHYATIIESPQDVTHFWGLGPNQVEDFDRPEAEIESERKAQLAAQMIVVRSKIRHNRNGNPLKTKTAVTAV